MATAYEEYQQMCAELDSLRQQVTTQPTQEPVAWQALCGG
jgi:hypothetical protein